MLLTQTGNPLSHLHAIAEAWRSLQFHLKRNHGIIVRRINGRVELLETADGGTVATSTQCAALEQKLNDMHTAVEAAVWQ
jgi:hypothetical protein